MDTGLPVTDMTQPRPNRAHLPTMYDLPSEEVDQPGLPDEYHVRQAQLLTETFQPDTVPPEQVFTCSDMNLYYDVEHTLYNKRPDWFAVVGVSRLYEERDMRRSYVLWQEEVKPLVIVELLSPSTEDEDLGRGRMRRAEEPPSKWEVYSRYLEVPYYVVFDGVTRRLQVFESRGGQFVPRAVGERGLWVPEAGLTLALWSGKYVGAHREWLRWQDRNGQWVLNVAEQVEQERTRAEQERTRAEQERTRAEQAEQKAAALAEKLRALGIDPETL